MITRDAIYDIIEALITVASPSDALFEAVSYRNLRGQVNSSTLKTVRVECLVGKHAPSDEDKRKEMNVQATIQCWVKPVSTSETDLDDAMDTSFDMSREIFDGLVENPGLDNAVCDNYFEDFETSYANMGSVRYGVTYLDGVINQAS